MGRFLWAGMWLFLVWPCVEVQAQGTLPVGPSQAPYVRPPVSPYPRPSVSPFLNLNRGGVPALNYYNLVRPQMDFQSSLNVLENRADLLGQSLEEGRTLGLSTGQPSQFMTHGRYFFNLGPRSAIARPATVPQAVTPAIRPGGN